MISQATAAEGKALMGILSQEVKEFKAALGLWGIHECCVMAMLLPRGSISCLDEPFRQASLRASRAPFSRN